MQAGQCFRAFQVTVKLCFGGLYARQGQSWLRHPTSDQVVGMAGKLQTIFVECDDGRIASVLVQFDLEWRTIDMCIVFELIGAWVCAGFPWSCVVHDGRQDRSPWNSAGGCRGDWAVLLLLCLSMQS